MSAALPPLVVPFTGERYAKGAALDALIAPPYDVITSDARARYAGQDPHNIVHLILPEAPSGEDRYARAAGLLAAWRASGVLRSDPGPAVYVVAERFSLPAGPERTRLGMFAAVAAEPYATRRVRPHEQTHAGPKADRLALLRATRTNLESIFLLAPDADGSFAAALARAARAVPTARATLDGVEVRLWVVTGAAAQKLAALGGRAQLYIADGHHRYETAVTYAAERPGTGAGRVLALLVPVSDPGLTILPTHRVVAGARQDPTALLAGWRAWFEVGRVAPCADRVERLASLGRERTACLVAFPDGFDVSLVLKPDAPLETMSGLGRSAAVRALDVARVETLVVAPLLATDGGSAPALTYTPDPYAAFAAVRAGGTRAAVLLNPTPVAQVLAVADAEDTMPPKSTYFVPKVPSGLVLRPFVEGGE